MKAFPLPGACTNKESESLGLVAKGSQSQNSLREHANSINV